MAEVAALPFPMSVLPASDAPLPQAGDTGAQGETGAQGGPGVQ